MHLAKLITPLNAFGRVGWVRTPSNIFSQDGNPIECIWPSLAHKPHRMHSAELNPIECKQPSEHTNPIECIHPSWAEWVELEPHRMHSAEFTMQTPSNAFSRVENSIECIQLSSVELESHLRTSSKHSAEFSTLTSLNAFDGVATQSMYSAEFSMQTPSNAFSQDGNPIKWIQQRSWFLVLIATSKSASVVSHSSTSCLFSDRSTNHSSSLASVASSTP